MPHGISATHTSVRKGGSGTTLESAVAHIERSIRANGGDAGIPEGERHGYEWRALYEWAFGSSLILSKPPERTGGREHDVLFDQAAGRWLKFTKPWSAGYELILLESKLLMLPATPLQYLRRWRIANRWFGQDAFLVGLYVDATQQRIVVSQQDAQGSSATWAEIEETFCARLGMRRILSQDPLGAYEARAYMRGRIAIFDVRPPNCVMPKNGTLVPIDVIPQALTRTSMETLTAITLAEAL